MCCIMQEHNNDKQSGGNTADNGRTSTKLKHLLRFASQGLVLVLPLLVTVWVVWWAIGLIENIFGRVLRFLLGNPPWEAEASVGFLGLESIYYIPGIGFVLGLVTLILLGFVARLWLVREGLKIIERMVERIPLVKTIYGSVRDILGFMGGDETRAFSKVVLVSLPGCDYKLVGLVTREKLHEIPGLDMLTDRVAVYLSLSYNFGGMTVLVSPDDVEEIDMSVEDGLRFSLTAGVSTNKLPINIVPPSDKPTDDTAG